MTLVLWSGGCDSTLVLLDLARQASTATPVRALSIEHTNIGAEKEQRRARTRILTKMKRSGLTIKHTTAKISIAGPHGLTGDGLTQPLIWMPTAVLMLEDKEDLHTGYIREDDIWHYRSQMYSLFGALQTFRNHSGELIAPLEWTSKPQVIGRLRGANLLDIVWWCESPKAGKPCRNCHECNRHYAAVRELEIQESSKKKTAKPKIRRKK